MIGSSGKCMSYRMRRRMPGSAPVVRSSGRMRDLCQGQHLHPAVCGTHARVPLAGVESAHGHQSRGPAAMEHERGYGERETRRRMPQRGGGELYRNGFEPCSFDGNTQRTSMAGHVGPPPGSCSKLIWALDPEGRISAESEAPKAPRELPSAASPPAGQHPSGEDCQPPR